MAAPDIRQMFEAGAHFGHQSRFWNPKMAPYIYGERNKIHIIDLDTVLPMLKSALDYLKTVSASGGKILFVGTKRAARDSIELHAKSCGMPYVNHRWLGGMLTNFKTVRLSVKRYTDLEEERDRGEFAQLSKKQTLRRVREILKLRRNLEGIKDMIRLPDAMFVVDVRHERIAVREATRLDIPIVAIVDTNNSFKGIDYMVPGNDDAIRAVDLYVSSATAAVLAGIEEKETQLAQVKLKSEIEGEVKTLPKVADKAEKEEKPGPDGETEVKPVRTIIKAAKPEKSAEQAGAKKPKVRMRGLLLRRSKRSQVENKKESEAASEKTDEEASPDAGQDEKQEEK